MVEGDRRLIQDNLPFARIKSEPVRSNTDGIEEGLSPGFRKKYRNSLKIYSKDGTYLGRDLALPERNNLPLDFFVYGLFALWAEHKVIGLLLEGDLKGLALQAFTITLGFVEKRRYNNASKEKEIINPW